MARTPIEADLTQSALPQVPLLRDGRYVRIWLVGWLTGVVRWLELLAFGILAWELTGSPSLVALLALLRFLPMALFSAIFGALADQMDPRRMMMLALLAITAVAVAMLALQVSGTLAYWHICACALASGVYWASDMPIRRKMMGEIAGPERLAQAMSWDYATSNGTRMVGPLIGGVLYQSLGMDGVFVLVIAHYLAGILCAAGLKPSGGAIPTGAVRPGRVLTEAWQALRHALRDNDMTSIMALTVIFNIWVFPYVSMIPVVGEEDLGLSAAMIGYISSIEGATGLMVIGFIGVFARPSAFRVIYTSGVGLAMGAVAFMGAATGFWQLILGLAVAGMFLALFASMQSTLVYRAAPDEMRGRYLGLISLCIGSGLIGFANIGLTAEFFGAANAMWIVAAEGALPFLIVILRWRDLHKDLGLRRR
ncbi:MAG: MFS transporter [Pseudomonadota bacterium]